MKPQVLIITGDGLNCEEETAFAFQSAGALPKKIHIQDLLDGDFRMEEFQILAFIGGFSAGDHLGSGMVQSARLCTHLIDDLKRFAEKKPIIGICNGFQTLVRLKLLPGSLLQNDSGKFIDRWVRLQACGESLWTRGIDTIDLPVRHKEGKFFCEEKVCPALQYLDQNPNGSQDDIAGITNDSGNVFGLMPHPEAFLFPTNHPHWQTEKKTGEGRVFFENAVRYF